MKNNIKANVPLEDTAKYDNMEQRLAIRLHVKKVLTSNLII